MIETIAVVLDIATVPDSLDKFHKGKLNSTKSMPAAKKCLPMLAHFYGMLSNDFVHIRAPPKSRGDDGAKYRTRRVCKRNL